MLPVVGGAAVSDPLHERAIRRSADRKSTRLNSSHLVISYAVFFFKKKTRLNSSHLVISYAVFCLKKKIGQLSGLHGFACDVVEPHVLEDHRILASHGPSQFSTLSR